MVAAAYLAKQGKKVLVLERRSIVGGSGIEGPLRKDSLLTSAQTGGTLRPDIINNLKLSQHGWMPSREKPLFISLLDASHGADGSYGDYLVIDSDPAKAAGSIKYFSEKDARRWAEFVQFMDKAAHILAIAYSTIMPRLPKPMSLSEGYGLMELGLDLRLAGRRDMLNFIRALPMNALELVEEYFRIGSPQSCDCFGCDTRLYS